MVHISKREYIQNFLGGHIKLHKSIVLLQAHPRRFRIFGNRNIFRFKRLHKALHTRLTNALRHQSKRIEFAKSDNPAVARLFTMFIMGGEDGTGAGYDAWVKRMGCYPTRTGVDAMGWNQYSSVRMQPGTASSIR